MRVLITGATGYLGAECAALLSAKHEVRVLVPEGADLGPQLTRQTQQVFGEVTEPDAVRTALRGCDAVIHARALDGKASEAELEGINVFGTENLLRSARSSGVRKVVYVSSYQVLGPSVQARATDERAAPLGREWVDHAERTRTIADHIVRDAVVRGYPVVTVYPTLLYGPGVEPSESWVMRFLLDLLQGRVAALVGDPRRRWNLAYGPDVARGVIQCLDSARSGSRYILGGDDAELATLLESVDGYPGLRLPRWHISDRTADWLLPALSPWLRLIGRSGHLDPTVLNAMRHAWSFSSARANAELGFACRPPLEGLPRTLDWLRDSGRWLV